MVYVAEGDPQVIHVKDMGQLARRGRQSPVGGRGVVGGGIPQLVEEGGSQLPSHHNQNSAVISGL